MFLDKSRCTMTDIDAGTGGAKTVAKKEVGAKQLAMYADSPARYCNLRGQVEGPSGAGGSQVDDDVTVRPDYLRRLLSLLTLLGAAASLVGAVQLWSPIRLPLPPSDDAVYVLAFLGGIVLFVVGVIGLFSRRQLARPAEIAQRFELDPAEFRLISASIMGNRGRPLTADGLSVIPHALFARQGAGTRSYHVTLFLNRPYAGRVHDADLYRLTLHMGVVKRSFRSRSVTGSIRYAGKRVKVAYSDSLYNSLRSMIPEYRESIKRWWPENRLSLRRRQRVAAGKAVRSQTVDWPDEYSL